MTTAGNYQGKHFTEWVDTVKSLRSYDSDCLHRLFIGGNCPALTSSGKSPQHFESSTQAATTAPQITSRITSGTLFGMLNTDGHLISLSLSDAERHSSSMGSSTGQGPGKVVFQQVRSSLMGLSGALA